MKIILFVMTLVICSSSFAFDVHVVTRKDLRFSVPDISLTKRTSESFKIAPTNPAVDKLVKDTARAVVALLPENLRKGEVTLNLEAEAIYVNSKGEEEKVPMTTMLSVEMSEVRQIRICTHELENNPGDLKSLVAHEMGHIITAIAWKASGKIPPNEINEWRWTKSIYEGVADYFAATVNNTPDAFGSRAWYSRDLLKYKTLQEAQKQTWIATIADIKIAVKQEGLLDYKAYQDMFANIEDELSQAPGAVDTNAVGSWLAGQLWLMNQKYGKDKVVNAVLKIALSAEKKKDPQAFVDEVLTLVTK